MGGQVTARTATEVLGWSRELVTPALRAAIDTLPGPVRRIAGYHFGWWDADGRPAGAGADSGKALRPALALLAATAVGSAPEPAVPAAVAVELVHNFSLLHDDVMDADTTRRHRPTVWTVFGIPAAILAGDALLALAFDVVAATGHPSGQAALSGLADAVQALVAGQVSDVDFERRTDVTLAECIRMAEGKTAALVGRSCALGAQFGNATTAQAGELHRFGDRMGLAFQLADDLLGIWGDPSVTGKPVFSDLVSRKKSLPVVAAINAGTPEAAKLAELYHSPVALDLAHTADLIEGCGGREWCRTRADELVAAALGHLAAARPAAPAEAELTGLARLATRRDH
ncbi:MAG TPA: family 2 encapsulin nanocompartment cargo protein polyprenyl transferase [Pseudonocardiaceae bacterium]|jgi:geranylgeranyl diphosphate synthase type I|nr:family 2 encapsulin nanocompartment cargo protein polyprenyl transferase [Pseudonocardiaceae bacterium]